MIKIWKCVLEFHKSMLVCNQPHKYSANALLNGPLSEAHTRYVKVTVLHDNSFNNRGLKLVGAERIALSRLLVSKTSDSAIRP